jgi:alpha-N-arabinofuranosidase
MEKLAAMRPSFCASREGNYLEGNRIESRFDWKKMIGPLVERPTHPGTWSYHSTDGMGLLEFLEWCEDLKMEPVSWHLCRILAWGPGGVKPGPDLEPYVQEGVEEIEYVTGGADTQMGGCFALRDGHPAPFRVALRGDRQRRQFRLRAKITMSAYARSSTKRSRRSTRIFRSSRTMPVKGITPDVVDGPLLQARAGHV